MIVKRKALFTIVLVSTMFVAFYFTLLLIGCNETNGTMINSDGLPQKDHKFSYMHFLTKDIGYLFGTYSPTSSIGTAAVYKTTDGGNSWIQIDSIPNCRFHGIATANKQGIYIEGELFKERFMMLYFDFVKERLKWLISTPSISCYWNCPDGIHYTNNREFIHLYSFKPEHHTLDSIQIGHYVLDAVSIEGKDYCIFTNYDQTYLGVIDDAVTRRVNLPIIPQKIVKISDRELLIAGMKLGHQPNVSLIVYDVQTEKTESIKVFENYNNIQDLKGNDVVVTGLLGNVKGMSVDYTLIYSTDYGKTWNIQKLVEPTYVSPNCLIEDIFYTYCGAGRIQKLNLKKGV